jgi:hypothetical protein
MENQILYDGYKFHPTMLGGNDNDDDDGNYYELGREERGKKRRGKKERKKLLCFLIKLHMLETFPPG